MTGSVGCMSAGLDTSGMFRGRKACPNYGALVGEPRTTVQLCSSCPAVHPSCNTYQLCVLDLVGGMKPLS